MSYKFSLETVLRYRAVLEKRELSALDALRQQGAALQARLRETNAAQQDAATTRERALASGTFGSELHHLEERERQLLQLQISIIANIEENAREQAAQLQRYKKAHIDCEVLSELKEKYRAAHIKEQDRREQRNIDDMISSRAAQDR